MKISDIAYPITDKEAEMIKNLAEVTSINRMGQQSAYLTDLAPVTASTSTEPDNLKVSLLSFDDMDTDSPFADQSYRLTDGELIKPETKYGAVIMQDLQNTMVCRSAIHFLLKQKTEKLLPWK